MRFVHPDRDDESRCGSQCGDRPDCRGRAKQVRAVRGPAPEIAIQPAEDTVDVEVLLFADEPPDLRREVAEVQSVGLSRGMAASAARSSSIG
jgi:hypothetical protein